MRSSSHERSILSLALGYYRSGSSRFSQGHARPWSGKRRGCRHVGRFGVDGAAGNGGRLEEVGLPLLRHRLRRAGRLRGGKVVNVRGDEEAHNKGVICIKGTMLRALPELPGRLLTPKIREGNKFVNATWDQALDLVAKKFQEILKAHGPDALAFYGSGQLFIEESYTANKMFKAGLRTNNVNGNPRLCMASAAVGYVNVFGKDEPAGCYEDIDHADCFFLIGSNAFECHPPVFERIRRRRAVSPQTKLICVDPRRTRTAELSDIHLPVVPGTDMLLLNAMAQVICEQGWADRKFIAEHVNFNDEGKTVSFEEYARFLNAYRPEKVAGELGVSAEAIREVAYHFAKSPATMSLWTMGMNQSAKDRRSTKV